ncbi:hypothetical protein [Ruegeria sp. EL01]|jgi:hypothetical protein|uniref:hypothetical protein n=1 Tax=Ruegeria sp. EL01 TaxID=2107578 RepID=UPI000EA7F9F4|nr:hypothetical protein [Ruegeria sp. EL01]
MNTNNKTSWTKWNGVPCVPGHDAGEEEKCRQLDPYIHWSLFGAGEHDIGTDPTAVPAGRFQLAVPSNEIKFNSRTTFGDLYDPLPIPTHALNKNNLIFPAKRPKPSKLPDKGEVPNDTIVAGVIDIGMPLGHWRTRKKNGETRFLSAWQMLANFDHSVRSEVAFGQQFHARDINKKLKEHSGGLQHGPLDEQGFNAATGGLVLDELDGPKSLGGRAAHGAHVLDMVAGALEADEIDIRDKVRIIGVNAPAASVFGSSGTYLEQFLFHALHYIVQMADAVWQKQNPKPKKGAVQGYPIVINMSFGRQAGSKDYYNTFTNELEKVQRFRRANKLSPLYFIFPAGNENLTQSNAFLEPCKGQEEAIDWRIPPQDQSSNFLEVWCNDDRSASTPVHLELSHPGGLLHVPPPKNDLCVTHFSDLLLDGDLVARVYVTRLRYLMLPKKPKAVKLIPVDKLQYVCCVAPTYRIEKTDSFGNTKAPAPAGSWTLTVKNVGEVQLTCSISIQSDQALTPRRSVNLRSTFEHPEYRTHDYTGRLVESYSFPPGKDGRVKNLDIETETPIRRHGTALATSGNKYVAQLGGYRASDGRPAFYSSTGRGRRKGQDDGVKVPSRRPPGLDGRRAPVAAFPTDDGHAHFGILAAGSSDGSVVALRGTSFASSQAARAVIKHLVTTGSSRDVEKILVSLARKADRHRPPELIEVVGAGRILSPVQRRIRRMG